ncbi:MAG TPA: hypothetical protein VFP72_17765 [Kineosporiaceae bacterium]|nr:hypothetical protein [Kineosporiaceae bacterium]
MDGAEPPAADRTGETQDDLQESRTGAPDEGSGESQAGSLAAKIDRLFRTTHPQGHSGEYTYEQVAAAIAERGGPTISASYLYLLRRGLRDNPTKRHLEALAGFFGVPVSYFVDDHDPCQEARLGLLSALRDPRVHELATTAAALPEQGLDLIARLVSLARDLDGLRGGRRRGPGQDPDPPASDPDLNRRVELELAYARLSLQEGEAAQALHRLTGLAEQPRLAPCLADETRWLVAHSHEALGEPERALTILRDLLTRCLDGASELPLALVGEEVCRLCWTCGDHLLAVEAGQRTLAGLEDRGMAGTEEHLRLASTLMQAQVDLGQLLHASALARQILSLADKVEDRARQARTYLDCARVAQSSGRVDEAIYLSRRALAVNADALADAVDEAPHLARLRVEAASCLLLGGPDQVVDAVVALEAARGELGERGSPLDRGRWAAERAVADLVLGQPVAAEVSARRALAHLAGETDPATVRAHLLLGDSLRAQGRHAHADAAHQQAGRVLAALPAGDAGQRRWAAGAWRSLGERWLHRGFADQAAEAFRRALEAGGLVAGQPVPQPVAAGPAPGRGSGPEAGHGAPQSIRLDAPGWEPSRR